MKRLLLLFFMMVLAWPVDKAQASLSTDNFPYAKTFQCSQEGFSSIILDSQVLANTRDDLADIRISNDDGQEIPYQLTQPSSAVKQVGYEGLLNESTRPDEYSVTIDFGNSGVLHNQLYLEIEAQNQYVGDLFLEGSNDNLQWSSITTSKIFFIPPDYRNSTFPYPNSSWRYLRARITAPNLPALKLHSIRAAYITRAETAFKQLPIQLLATQQDAKTGRTYLTLDLGVKGYYLHKIVLSSASRNYQRPVRLDTGDTQDQWMPLGTGGNIYHFKWADYEAREDSLIVDQRAARYLKVTIDNGSSPPLDLSNIIATGCFPSLLADLQPGRYHLWFGNTQASQPNYDLARFSDLVDSQSLPLITLNSQEANPDYSPPKKPWTERNAWLLNITLIGVVIIIGAVTWRTLRHS